MKFDTSIVGCKTPSDGAVLGIALDLQRGNTFLQDLHALNPARQAAVLATWYIYSEKDVQPG